jgi:hypothetical protein
MMRGSRIQLEGETGAIGSSRGLAKLLAAMIKAALCPLILFTHELVRRQPSWFAEATPA